MSKDHPASKTPTSKKKYEAPAIIHDEVVEALAGTCGSSFDGIDTCRVSGPSCDATQT